MNKIIDTDLTTESLQVVLLVELHDHVDVKARVTFDYEIFQGYQVTFWQDDDTDVIKRVNSIFDLLFEEVLKQEKLTISN